MPPRHFADGWLSFDTPRVDADAHAQPCRSAPTSRPYRDYLSVSTCRPRRSATIRWHDTLISDAMADAPFARRYSACRRRLSTALTSCDAFQDTALRCDAHEFPYDARRSRNYDVSRRSSLPASPLRWAGTKLRLVAAVTTSAVGECRDDYSPRHFFRRRWPMPGENYCFNADMINGSGWARLSRRAGVCGLARSAIRSFRGAAACYARHSIAAAA